MSLDDFEPDEYDDEEEEYQQSGSSESIKDKYDRYKDYKEKYEKYKEKYGNGNDVHKPNNEQFRNATNQQLRSKATEEGAKSVAKEGSKELAKEGSKQVVKEGAKEVGKEVAKEGAKIAAKEGAKVTAEAASAATGVGIIVAAAIEVADQLFKKLKLIWDKEARKKEKEKAKKRLYLIIFLLCAVLIIFIPIFVAGPLLVASEETTASLEQIINNREERYTDELHKKPDTSSIYRKTLMMFTDDEYEELLFKNYDKIDGSKPTAYKDPCYNFTMKRDFGTDIVNFFAKQEDLKGKDDFEVTTKVVKNFVEAEKENFNKISWYESSGLSSYSYTSYNENFSSIANMEANDKKPSRTAFVESSAIANSDLQLIPYTELKIPSLAKYETDPTVTNTTQKAYTYAQSAQDYVQRWFIPYTMMIDTQDKDFVVDEVVKKMYHPIDYTLFQINRENKTTTTQYYLETDRKMTWDEYDQTEVTISYSTKVRTTVVHVTYKPNGEPETHHDDPQESDPTFVSSLTTKSNTTKENKEQDLGKSNTRDSTVGVEEFPAKATKTQTSSESETEETVIDSDEDSNGVDTIVITETIQITTTTTTVYHIKDNYKRVTTLTDGGKIAYENGEPMVKNINIVRSIYPYRYIPKITHAETFYEVINASYSVMPIDETLPPRTRNESSLSVSADSSYGQIVIKEMWEENLATGMYESKPYKVSYYSDADLKRLNKKVSRVEWFQDWGDKDSTDTPPTGTDVSGGAGEIIPNAGVANSQNMAKLIQHAHYMVNNSTWVYGQGGDRGVSYSLEQLNGKRNIDCSSFVSSLYNIFLGVNPGSNTRDMHARALAGTGGFRLFPLDKNSLQPGDILWKSGHVGLYIGNGMQIDAGGPTGVKEPNQASIGSRYTHIIRYMGADFSDVDVPAGDGTSGDVDSPPSTEKGNIYPSKSYEERMAAYNAYGKGKGYSYDDMYFAYYQIEKRLLKLSNVTNSGSISGFGGLGFGWPVDLGSSPGSNVINCFYGYTPAYGEDHPAIDISSGGNVRKEGNLSIGPNIVAAHSGTVIAASGNPTSDADGYTYVNIKTEDGSYVTQYGHLSKIYVSVGDTVSKGQVIGLMGNTGRSTGVHLHFAILDSAGNSMNPLNFYNIAKASDPDTIANLADIDLLSITGIPTGYIYHSAKNQRGSGEGFSVVGTTLSKTEWVDKALAYANGKSTDACFKNKATMESFYDICVSKGVNPEYAFATAVTEQNLRNSKNNYWGLATPNGSGSAHFGDMLTTLSAYCDTIVNYQDPASSKYSMIMQRYEERKAVTENGGADPNGYGTPDTLQGIQSIYSFLGKHEYGSAGAGGFYYMDPSRAGVTKIYSTHEEFIQKCRNGGSAHAMGTVTTVWEQAGYTAWQAEKKISVAKKIFGEAAGTY